MKLRMKSRLFLAGLVLALIVGAFVGGLLLQRGGRADMAARTTISGEVIAQEIYEISELAVLRYHYTNAAKFDNYAEINNWKVPFSTKSFIIKYYGEIKLGVEAKDIDVNVNERSREIIITLPPVKVLSHAIDESSLEVWDQTKNIFNPILIEDYAAFAVDQKNAVVDSNITGELIEEAAENARRQIGTLVRNLAGVRDEYTVLFALPAEAEE